jgi:catechol-2,3-dioxygenase
MATVQRLNHAVLYVQDAAASAKFYCNTLGFDVVYEMQGAAFLRAKDSKNDHDLGLFSVGKTPGPERGRRGLYHLAWQVDTIDDLAAVRIELQKRGALVGESDHGASKSLYANDPDGIEFEVMWAVPHGQFTSMGVAALHLEAEIARWSGIGTGHEANVAPSSNSTLT